ncbi:SPASM domain-containing protein [Streptomyces sp. NPDC019531]|uniref:SPASM domain-containing protein n=1 Tax=Streptomyces sp. NPDC019531 TaxID=3365062 RepID=UPI00384B87E2
MGDVYACPFAVHDAFRAGNVLDLYGFTAVWRESPRFPRLRAPQEPGACGSCAAYDSCRGGCTAARFFTGLPMDGQDPECVQWHGERALSAVAREDVPRPDRDHSRTGAAAARRVGPLPVQLSRPPPQRGPRLRHRPARGLHPGWLTRPGPAPGPR